MLNTPEDPLATVPRLRSKNPRYVSILNYEPSFLLYDKILRGWYHVFHFHRIDSTLFGHYRLYQDTDNQTDVYVVVSKRKEEVGLPIKKLPSIPTVLFY